MINTFYISTAIPYVNAAPHVGFGFELLLADALARFERQQGRDVWFQTGTDENSLKNVRAAQALGLSPAALGGGPRAAISGAEDRAEPLLQRLCAHKRKPSAPRGRGAPVVAASRAR